MKWLNLTGILYACLISLYLLSGSTQAAIVSVSGNSTIYGAPIALGVTNNTFSDTLTAASAPNHADSTTTTNNNTGSTATASASNSWSFTESSLQASGSASGTSNTPAPGSNPSYQAGVSIQNLIVGLDSGAGTPFRFTWSYTGNKISDPTSGIALTNDFQLLFGDTVDSDRYLNYDNPDNLSPVIGDNGTISGTTFTGTLKISLTSSAGAGNLNSGTPYSTSVNQDYEFQLLVGDAALVPAPASIWLLGSGLLGLIGLTRRQKAA